MVVIKFALSFYHTPTKICNLSKNNHHVTCFPLVQYCCKTKSKLDLEYDLSTCKEREDLT